MTPIPGFAVCAPQRQTSRSVVDRAVLIPSVCRAWHRPAPRGRAKTCQPHVALVVGQRVDAFLDLARPAAAARRRVSPVRQRTAQRLRCKQMFKTDVQTDVQRTCTATQPATASGGARYRCSAVADCGANR